MFTSGYKKFIIGEISLVQIQDFLRKQQSVCFLLFCFVFFS